MKTVSPHQYVERATGKICTEKLYQDRLISLIYSRARENAPAVFNALTSARFSSLLGWLGYDMALSTRLAGTERFLF